MNNVDLEPRPVAPPEKKQRTPAFEHARGTIVGVTLDGWLDVDVAGRPRLRCEWLHALASQVPLVGDAVLLLIPYDDSVSAIVLGRVGPVTAGSAPTDVCARVRIEATERLTLSCGRSSIDLRSDGKVLISGDDVLVRAKGTKRIRAGTVSIN
jgi:hypothetical protein